jgi:hypothetical protein
VLKEAAPAEAPGVYQGKLNPEIPMKGKMILIVSAAATFAALASAQNVLPNQPNLPPSTPPIPGNPNPAVPTMPIQPVGQPTNVSAGTAAGASSGAAGSVQSPINRPDVGASTNVNTGVNADSRTDTTIAPQRIDAGNNSQVTLDNRVTGVGSPAVVTGETSASLRADETVSAIQSTRFATRDRLAANVEERLSATNNLLGELGARATASGDTSKAAFGRALAEVRDRERALRASLKAATTASSETAWGAAQSQLAQDYDAYARAVTEAEVAARATK